MTRFHPVVRTLIAGGLAALATSVLIWLFTVTGVFVVLGVPVAAPVQAGPWFVWRIVRGALWGLLFLVPLWAGRAQWKRGLLVAVAPIAVLLLWRYPTGGQGWLGLELGVLLPIAAIVFWLLWGLIAGWLLERLRPDGMEPEDEEPAAESSDARWSGRVRRKVTVEEDRWYRDPNDS